MGDVGFIKLHIFPWELLKPELHVAFESMLGEFLGSAVTYKKCSYFGRRMEWISSLINLFYFHDHLQKEKNSLKAPGSFPKWNNLQNTEKKKPSSKTSSMFMSQKEGFVFVSCHRTAEPTARTGLQELTGRRLLLWPDCWGCLLLLADKSDLDSCGIPVLKFL